MLQFDLKPLARECRLKISYNATINLSCRYLGPFYAAMAVPSVTRCRCRCRCGHRFYIAIHHVSLLSHAACAIAIAGFGSSLVVVSTVATPGEWQCKIRTGSVRRLAVANGPNIFQMLLVYLNIYFILHVLSLLELVRKSATAQSWISDSASGPVLPRCE